MFSHIELDLCWNKQYYLRHGLSVSIFLVQPALDCLLWRNNSIVRTHSSRMIDIATQITLNCATHFLQDLRTHKIFFSHNGLPFSTFDVDNDNREGDFAERSCARLYKVSKLKLSNIFFLISLVPGWLVVW